MTRMEPWCRRGRTHEGLRAHPRPRAVLHETADFRLVLVPPADDDPRYGFETAHGLDCDFPERRHLGQMNISAPPSPSFFVAGLQVSLRGRLWPRVFRVAFAAVVFFDRCLLRQRRAGAGPFIALSARSSCAFGCQAGARHHVDRAVRHVGLSRPYPSPEIGSTTAQRRRRQLRVLGWGWPGPVQGDGAADPLRPACESVPFRRVRPFCAVMTS